MHDTSHVACIHPAAIMLCLIYVYTVPILFSLIYVHGAKTAQTYACTQRQVVLRPKESTDLFVEEHSVVRLDTVS